MPMPADGVSQSQIIVHQPIPSPHVMETERPPRRPQPPPGLPAAAAVATAAAVSAVFGDVDLLREILLRVCLPGSLLRAALVCKRWLRLAADPAFLRHFRARHSPYLLGAYLSTAGGATPRPRFLQIQQLPREFAEAARRAGSFFDASLPGSSASIRDSHGGRLLVTTVEMNYGRYDSTHQVCRPLSSSSVREDTVVVVPPPTPPLPRMVTDPEPEVEDGIACYCHQFLPDDGGDGRSASYSCVLMGYSNQQTTVHLYELRDWHWVLRASAAARLRVSPPRLNVVLVDKNRFYMLSTINKILVSDFQSSSISAMELPDGVEEGHSHTGRIMLSRGDGSGIYLIHVEESQLLRVFRSDNAGSCWSWTLQNRINLHELRATLGIADCRPPVEGNGAGVKIHAVGDNARFVFLEILGAVVFLDMTSKQANKIYEMTPQDKELVSVHPLTLECPQIFLGYTEGTA